MQAGQQSFSHLVTLPLAVNKRPCLSLSLSLHLRLVETSRQLVSGSTMPIIQQLMLIFHRAQSKPSLVYVEKTSLACCAHGLIILTNSMAVALFTTGQAKLIISYPFQTLSTRLLTLRWPRIHSIRISQTATSLITQSPIRTLVETV